MFLLVGEAHGKFENKPYAGEKNDGDQKAFEHVYPLEKHGHGGRTRTCKCNVVHYGVDYHYISTPLARHYFHRTAELSTLSLPISPPHVHVFQLCFHSLSTWGKGLPPLHVLVLCTGLGWSCNHLPSSKLVSYLHRRQ